MFRLLRRYQPHNPLLLTVYWALVVVAILSALFLLFFYLDSVLELGGGMF